MISGTPPSPTAANLMAGTLRPRALQRSRHSKVASEPPDQNQGGADHWPVPLDALTDEPQFPGIEVERADAWGLVGRRKGSGDGRSVMLNAHIDVVPTR